MAKILLIEDEEALRELFCEILESYGGHTMVSAANGVAGVDAFDPSIDLVVTDMNMPGRNGLQTAKMLRERDPHLPIIIMTGHPGQSDELTNFATGQAVTRFLYKPFTPEVMRDTVAELLWEVATARQ